MIDLAELGARLAGDPDADRLHPIGLRRIVAGRNTLAALPSIVHDLCADGPVALLVDATPMRCGDEELKPWVRRLLRDAGRDVRDVVAGPEDGRAHADEATVAAVREQVTGAAVIVTVGSGTVADIGKTVADALGGLPHLIVQTAASVNGYSDDQAVLLRNGVKRTVPARWPDALVLDADILLGAPAPMNRAGLGDLMSMFTAPADWYLARAVGLDDSYTPGAVAIGRERGEELLALAPALAAADPDAVVRLAEILAVSGISMGVAGRTAPSSGMEHTVSHLLEMAAERQGRPTDLHGAKVGVSTIIAALTWQHVRRHIAEHGLRLEFPDPAQMRERVAAAFDPIDPSGAMSRECWAEYETKLKAWHDGRDGLARFVADWARHESTMDRLLVDPVRLVDALRAAGAPVRFADLDPPVDLPTARWALANCHLMRKRFTVADLAWFLGIWTEEHVDAVLAQAGAESGAVAIPRQRRPEHHFRGYALDLDGTVYLGDTLLPGARQTIERIRDRGGRVVFVTNKPIESAAGYAAKLTRLGVPAVEADVVTALDSLLLYLHRHHPASRVLTIAEPLVEKTLADAGWPVVRNPAEAELVVVSFDRTFHYGKLAAAFQAVVHHGAAIVATNPDPYCPTPDGGLPDCAAMLAALEACTGVRAEAVLGKPSATMAEALLERLDTTPAEAVMVGDRLSTDVAMGQLVGMAGVLVLSGATSQATLARSDIRPDYVVDGIHHLLPDDDEHSEGRTV